MRTMDIRPESSSRGWQGHHPHPTRRVGRSSGPSARARRHRVLPHWSPVARNLAKGVAVSDEENLDLIRRFNQTPGAKDLSLLDELIAQDYVAHGGDQEIRGRDGWKQFLLAGAEEFGDSESGIDELIGNGNLVAERWWIRAAAGVRRGITIHRIENNKIQEDWVVWQDTYNDGASPQG